jgi:hypothetical protein
VTPTLSILLNFHLSDIESVKQATKRKENRIAVFQFFLNPIRKVSIFAEN